MIGSIEKPTSATGGPPQLPFALTVGVTGHRLGALADARRAAVRDAIGQALEAIEREAMAVFNREAGLFATVPPTLTLVSPLADGADQMAAEAGLARGWRLQTVLPFDRATYIRDFDGPEAAARFTALLERSDCVLELPGDPDDDAEAYMAAGRATIAHCDVLIAVWDGRPPRGRGGTAEVVHLAVAQGTPVIHVAADGEQPMGLLWSGFDPNVITRSGDDRGVRQPFEPELLGRMIGALLTPPPESNERVFFDRFLAEKSRRVRGRIEYPLLLMLAGVSWIKSSHWRESKCAAAINDEWQRFSTECSGKHGITASLDLLERAYASSDRLAGYYAQNFRSGHIFNFLLAATAVLLGLSSFALPASKTEVAVVEFAVALAVIFNTRFGVSHEWHRRWLDYRQLAERLRPLRSLKLLGVAAPDAPGSNTNPVPRRWIDWYAAGVWRAMGCPNGTIDQAKAAKLAEAIACHEIAPQIAYHEATARQIDTLDRRLEWIATGLFVLTLGATALVIIMLQVDPAWVDRMANWLTLLSAGFPAVGTAIFGIRFQGDLGGSAERSRSTAQTLRAIEAQMEGARGDLSRSADLFEQSARAMLADLDEWRLVNQQQELSVS
ncbi:MAG TPA: hypothetical protein VGR05_00850 [Sphingomicrobium sp.]|nr:hypothetical protein [Sphingomicrobium sp.]